MRKNGLDEMQLQKRNKYGNQAFMMLSYLIMIDTGLYGYGIRWLAYPVNVFIIMLACMSYYLVRLIWSNAYIGPEGKNKAVRKKSIYITVIVAVLAAVIAFLAQKGLLEKRAVETNDNSAWILVIFSVVSLVIAAVVSIIRKRRDKESE